MKPHKYFVLRLKQECDVEPEDVECHISVFQAGRENDKQVVAILARPNFSVSM